MGLSSLAGLGAKTVALCLAALLTACQPQPIYEAYDGQSKRVYPGKSWAKAESPEALGWSSARLAEARALSDEIGTTAVMIVHDGVVVDAWGEVAVKSNLHSVRKSLLSALIGTQVDAGAIDLGDTMAALGIDDNAPSLTEVEKQATVGDLIKARSGIYHAALYETRQMTASKPPRGSHAPGTYWHYNNWDFNALGTIYEQESGEKIFEAFQERIAGPLGMEDFEVGDGEYFTGEQSIHSAYPFRMTARDLARFALLFERDGRWRDTQIVSADWVAESTSAHSETGPGRGYGYMWWTVDDEAAYANLGGHHRFYYAAGYGGQYAFVFPDLDLVVVHRVNTDRAFERAPEAQIGRLLWLILAAAGVEDIGPDPSLEAAAGERLDNAGLRRVLSGQTFRGNDRDGNPWRVTFNEDGDLIGVAGHNDEQGDQGTWRIEDDAYCRQWKKWAGGKDGCFVLVQEGTILKAYDSTGTLMRKIDLAAS
ncbi:MAG: serine hydrolase [Pseudomonadota bacterium]